MNRNELKLPASCSMIDEEEMTYLMGGDGVWDTVLDVGRVFNYVARIFSAASSIINNFNTIFNAFNSLNTLIGSMTGSST